MTCADTRKSSQLSPPKSCPCLPCPVYGLLNMADRRRGSKRVGPSRWQSVLRQQVGGPTFARPLFSSVEHVFVELVKVTDTMHGGCLRNAGQSSHPAETDHFSPGPTRRYALRRRRGRVHPAQAPYPRNRACRWRLPGRGGHVRGPAGAERPGIEIIAATGLPSSSTAPLVVPRRPCGMRSLASPGQPGRSRRKVRLPSPRLPAPDAVAIDTERVRENVGLLIVRYSAGASSRPVELTLSRPTR